MLRKVLTTVCLLVFVFIGGVQQAVYSQGNGTSLTKFEGTGNQLVQPFDGYVYGFTDKKNGGTSTITGLETKGDESVLNPITKRGEGAEKSSGFLKISGEVTVTEKFQYGFAGCGFNFYKERKPFDLSQYKGIRFYAKGSENYFIVKIEIPDDVGYAFHETVFMPTENWDVVTLYFKDFVQPSWNTKEVRLEDPLKRCKGIQWHTKGQPIKKYELYLDNIELIK